jgi:FkbH-like protein
MLGRRQTPRGHAAKLREAVGEVDEIRDLVRAGRFDDAWRSLVPDLLAGDTGATWSLARNVIKAGASKGFTPPTARSIRLAVLCTYEAAELRELLRLACLAMRIDAEIYAAPYGQVEQEVLSDGPLKAFAPSHVLIAPTTEDLGLAELTSDPERALSEAVGRWVRLWSTIREDLGARVLQHTFVVPDETPLGHLAARVAGSRIAVVRTANERLAEAAGGDVLLIDTERLAARMGKQQWLDPRLWYAARQPLGADALRVLMRETAAVLEGDVGLAPRCLVVDLDNTLWGGIVGEEGPDGIAIGEGSEGEAYATLQEYLKALKERGVVLAVASKNDAEAAREPFETNPRMRLGLDDFAAFVADWRPKSEQLTDIAGMLGLGLESLAFIDDNPAECLQVSAALPQVRTLCLDTPPSERVRVLATSLHFELSALSAAELERGRSYAARAKAAELQAGATSLEDFWRSLQMRARIRAIDGASLDRAAQLTQKTNQFNLTLNRRTREEVAHLISQDRTIGLTLELEDRFAAHGLIGLGIIVPGDDPETALVDTLLMSCRVIGRTAESHLLGHLAREAQARGFSRLRGVYTPGPRNQLVADLYPKLGFTAVPGDDHAWEYELEASERLVSDYIAEHP